MSVLNRNLFALPSMVLQPRETPETVPGKVAVNGKPVSKAKALPFEISVDKLKDEAARQARAAAVNPRGYADPKMEARRLEMIAMLGDRWAASSANAAIKGQPKQLPEEKRAEREGWHRAADFLNQRADSLGGTLAAGMRVSAEAIRDHVNTLYPELD